MDAVAIFEMLTLHVVLTPCELRQAIASGADIKCVKYTDDYEITKLVESRELQGTCLCGAFSQKAHLDGVHTQLHMYTSIL